MLNIRVNMHGNLRRFLPEGASSVCLQAIEGTTVREIAEQFDAQDEIWLSAIGQTVVPLTMPLTEDVAVDFFSIIEGG